MVDNYRESLEHFYNIYALNHYGLREYVRLLRDDNRKLQEELIELKSKKVKI